MQPGIIIKILMVLLVSALPMRGLGQEPADTLSIVDRLSLTPGVTIDNPLKLNERLERAVSNSREAVSRTGAAQTKRQGFRIEVYSDNTRQGKSRATARRNNIQARFATMRTYLMFESPFWRVRVGDFANRQDAESALAQLKQAFPSYASQMRVVRDKIN